MVGYANNRFTHKPKDVAPAPWHNHNPNSPRKLKSLLPNAIGDIIYWVTHALVVINTTE